MSETETAATETTTSVSLTVDGRVITAAPGELVIAAAERAGVYIPRFCYHPRMSSVGMCRMCLVEVEGPRGSALQVSCMLDVADGMIVHTESPAVKKAQDGVLEFLLINHPLDCPVCDKGGECPLQDQTLAFGPGESRFVEEKRHFEKPIPISDLVYLDRERCILCDRCTRFASEVAGDPLISFVGRGNEMQVLTFPDEPFASYFSGNTVQICPVGALTAKPYRFKARPWDLEEEESTCTTCSVGCRVTVQSSRNRVLRYQGVDIDPVNWGWLCDKGRFAFEAIESGQRLSAPLVREDDDLVESGWAPALERAAVAIRTAVTEGGPTSVAVIGGARLTNEDCYAWVKLAKGIIGTDNVDAQLGDGLTAELVVGLPAATIDEACAAGTLLVLAPDLKEELPVLYLRVRDAVEKRGLRVVELSPTATSMTPLAAASLRYRPGEQAALAASLVSGDAPPAGIGADWFSAGTDIVVLVGRPSVAESSSATEAAAAAIAGARPDAPLPRRHPSRERARRHRHGDGARVASGASRTRPGSRFVHRALGSGACRPRPGCHRHPPGRCRRRHRLPDPARRRPPVGLPGSATRRASTREREAGDRRRHVPHRLTRTRVGGACRGRIRREAGHHDEPRRAGEPARPEGHAAGHVTIRLDDRGRARRPSRR